MNEQRHECCCSSGVEHFLGKEEVEGSIPFNSSIFGSFLTTVALVEEVSKGRSQQIAEEQFNF